MLKQKKLPERTKSTSISYIDRETGEEYPIELQGVFVQIGHVPNTEWLGDTVERTRNGEIIVDKRGATNIPGVFAAGDVRTAPISRSLFLWDQAQLQPLEAFDYLIRN